MKYTQAFVSMAAVALLCSCASKQTAPAPTPAPAPAPAAAATPAPSTPGAKVVKSRDGSFNGEVIGTAAPGSKFAKLQIGMQMNEVQDVMGRAPDRFHTYESGKRWIPFYFGNDARRMQVIYKGEGCLMFTGGNVWGSSGGDLIGIHHDPSGNCYKP